MKIEEIVVEKMKSTDGPKHSIENETSLKLRKQLAIISVIVLLTLTVVVLIVVISTHSCTSSSSTSEKHLVRRVDKNDEPIFSNIENIFVEKNRWGGKAPSNFSQLHVPVPLVVIAHTATPTCQSFSDCRKRVQSIQNYHMMIVNTSDITYNFLVGGDGKIFIGRGWDARNHYLDNSIFITFIGNYNYDILDEKMISAAEILLDKGVKIGKLSETYKLVAQNQTMATISPGIHVYETIKTWKHFEPSLKLYSL